MVALYVNTNVVPLTNCQLTAAAQQSINAAQASLQNTGHLGGLDAMKAVAIKGVVIVVAMAAAAACCSVAASLVLCKMNIERAEQY